MNTEVKFTKNILIVTISNIVRLVAGMAIGLIIPKILSKSDYGFYKTYTLYMTYISIFTLGFIDGIYLKYGGKSYDELSRTKFRFYIRFLFFLELAMALILFVVSLLCLNGEAKIIFISIAANLIAQQLLTYFTQVSQLSSGFNIISIFNVIWSIVTLAGIGIIALIPNANYFAYIIIVVASNYLLLIYYFIKYRSIVFGKAEPISNEKSEIKELICLGAPLMIANLVSILVLSCDRLFVENLTRDGWFWTAMYTEEEYSSYSFAYSLFSIANTFTTAVSMVLYPTLKKMDSSDLKNNYLKAVGLMLVIVYTGLAMYFPLYAIITWWLPNYVDSLIIFRTILPGLALSTIISVVIQNYYKAANKNLEFFIKSIVVLILGIVTNVIAIILFKEPIYLSIASVITLFIWYILCELFFIKNYKVYPIKNFLFLIISSTAFYLISWIDNIWLGFLIYVLIEGLIIIICYGKLLLDILKKFRRKEVVADGKNQDSLSKE